MVSRTRFEQGIPTWLILVAMFLGGLCALLALNTASAASEVEQRGVVNRNATAADLEQQLARDLAAREAPENLAKAATALGLVPNPNPAFLRINANGSVTVLGQPMPASVPPTPVALAPAPAVTPKASATPTASPTPKASGTATRKASAAASPKASSTPTVPRPAQTKTSKQPAPRASATGGHG